MQADKCGTPTQQHLFSINYQRPSERIGDKTSRCGNCRFLSVVRSGMNKQKLICQHGPDLRVQAGAFCKNWKVK